MKSRTRQWIGMAVLGLVAAIAVGCGGSDAKAPVGDAGSAAAGKPVSGGTLTLLNSADGDPNLDPATWGNLYALAGGYVGTRALAIFDTLLYERSDGSIVPRLATSFATEDGGRTWTLALRPKLKFSDGTPFDAEAVKFNWERIKDPATKSKSLGSASQIAALRVVDPTTLEIQLVAANAEFDRVVALFLSAIQSPTALRKAGPGYGTTEFPIGAGPFVVQSRTAGNEMTLVRNPTYWDAPRPYLDKIVFRTILDDSQRSNTFRSGAAQVNVPLGLPQVQQEKAAGFAQYLVKIGGGRPMYLNNNKAPFDDPVARKALAAAFDQQAYVDTVQFGLGQAVDNLFYKTSPFFKTTPAWPAADPKRAAKLLGDYTAKHGGPLEFTLQASVTIRAEAEYIQASLNRNKGLHVELELLEPYVLTPNALSHNFQATILNLVYVDPEPALAQQLQSDSARNFTGYANPAMDAALLQGRTAKDQQERGDAYAQVGKLFNQDVPWIWTTRTSGYVSHTDAVGGIETLEDGAPIPWGLFLRKG